MSKMGTYEVVITTTIKFTTTNVKKLNWELLQPFVAQMQKHAHNECQNYLPDDCDYLHIYTREDAKLLESHYANFP